MKFLCTECDSTMTLDEREEPGDGTFAVSYTCPDCHRSVAMLANPMEAELVGSMGLEIGGSTLSPAPGKPAWTAESEARLKNAPRFVQGMVRKIYNDWAEERGIREITVAVMDEARTDLGLEGM